MRSVTGLPVPSKSLLRYLRTQSNVIRHDGTIILSTARSPRRIDLPTRCPSTTTRHYGSSSSHSREDSLAKTHEPLKALPAPRSVRYPSHPRHASTRAPRPQGRSFFQWPSFWSRFRRKRDSSTRQERSATQPIEDETAQLFNLSRALARSPATTDLKLRCTEFDANGSVTLVSGEFKKSELIAKYGLLPRDLRKIDSSVLPHILVRPTAILINLLHLRVLIQCDRVLVFDVFGSTDSYTQSLFMYDLEGKLRQKPDPRSSSSYLPYEFRALEAVLISVTSGLEAEFALVRDPVTHILQELEEDIDREKLRHLLIHSKKLGTFEQKARLVRDAIDDLLEADDDLASMYLTERKSKGSCRPEDDHQEIEMLLESYHKICDEIVEISGNLISNIRNTEEVVKAILDANRNQLMLLSIKFDIGTLGVAGGTLLAGLYGMNLENFIEETNWGFGAISATSFVFTGLICMYGMRKLRKMQKVRMFGEGLDGLGSTSRLKNRGNWRNEALQSENQAYFQRLRMLQERGLWQQHYHQQGASNNGPVLWPGMDGLGMHKLSQAQAPGASKSQSPSPGTPGGRGDDVRDEHRFHICDDVSNTEERVEKETNAHKAVATTSAQGGSSGKK